MFFNIVFFPSDNSLCVCNGDSLHLEKKPNIGQDVQKEFYVEKTNDDGTENEVLESFDGFVVYVDERKLTIFLIV